MRTVVLRTIGAACLAVALALASQAPRLGDLRGGSIPVAEDEPSPDFAVTIQSGLVRAYQCGILAGLELAFEKNHHKPIVAEHSDCRVLRALFLALPGKNPPELERLYQK